MATTPTLVQLRFLVALADAGSFTRAARECGVSQQALSRSIGQLERLMGGALFRREPTGSVPTAAGLRLLPAARRLLADGDRMIELTEGPPARAGDLVTVGMLLDGLGPTTGAVLAGFRALQPAVRVSIRSLQVDEIPGAVLTGEVDLALVHGPVRDERLVAHPLFCEPRAVVVSRSDPRADADHLSVADLLPLPARQRPDGVDPAWDGFFTLTAERNGEQPCRRGTPAGSAEELWWSIGADRLFLTVPDHLAATYPGPTFGVRYLPVPDLPAVVFSVCHRRGDPRPAVRRFVEVARAIATGPDRSGPRPTSGPGRRGSRRRRPGAGGAAPGIQPR